MDGQAALSADVQNEAPESYDFVSQTARIAVYDDFRSVPRVIEIPPNKTLEFIESLSTTVYENARKQGGKIPYTVIREVAENFIHARFQEIVVSIIGEGNTIRFADQGPGIPDKLNAQRPGFTSATEQMKQYIRGVGSGLPYVKEYMDYTNGMITLEDNLGTGAVVTISLTPYDDQVPQPSPQKTAGPKESTAQTSHISAPFLSAHAKKILPLLYREGQLGVTDLSRMTNIALSSIHQTLSKLEDAGFVERVGKKRTLTEEGKAVALQLS